MVAAPTAQAASEEVRRRRRGGGRASMIRLHWVLSLLGWSPLRRFGLSGLLGLFGWVSLAGVAAAQDAPALRVTATLQAPAEVRVGATVRLQLEVLTPTWFTQPPVLPALDIPGALVTPPQGEGELVRDSSDGRRRHAGAGLGGDG
ncbi:hypothetical protein G6F65_021284 [Rhizopus arrhizus]|nr:hypothetical protein G6F65_021284 [Rhizopus arrhizus]